MEFQDSIAKPRGVYCSKTRLVIVAFLWIAITVAVGVLAGLYGKQCPGGSKDPQVGNPTDKPAELPVEPWKELRLPDYTVPVHYDVSLFPDFYGDNQTFYGKVSVDIHIKRETPYLLIHYKQMNITETRVTETDCGKSLAIKRTFGYLEHEFWVVELQESLKVGNAVTLHLSFDGSLKNGIVGIYKSTYINTITGQARGLATSKFEPVDARKAFPCFDEPNIKANFTVTLKHDPSYIALSNMPVQSNKYLENGMIETTFQKSVPMSTYLVCFIVCDFEYKEKTSKSGMPFRVYATPDKIDQVEYALDAGVHIFNLYEEYFDMPYVLPKQDMIAIPDFVSGAMEHWGLITYRETNLLYNPNEASSSNKQRVAVVVAHELAHQWFGNIVTMDWWDDLWLNEGFASFMEYKGTDSYEPDWDMLDQFVTEDLQPVMITDGTVASHPIVVKVNNPSEITEVFDSISYSKGASVIRMLEAFMGKDNFMQGIQKYLKKYVYGNAKTQDLWAALQEVPDSGDEYPDVAKVMDTWTRQMGYPVINIQYANNELTATQERFLSDPTANVSAGQQSPYGYKWYVPLHYTTSTNAIPQLKWMEMQDSIKIDSPVGLNLDASDWIKCNVNTTAYYRVNYPTKVWHTFSSVLENNTNALWPADRAGLVGDAFNLARAGKIEYTIPLTLIKYLKSETHFQPWDSAKMGMDYIDDMLFNTSSYAKWGKYMVELANPALDNIGWNDSVGGHLDKSLRNVVIRQTCGHGNLGCLDMAATMFRDWMNGATLHPNLRSVVYQYGMQKIGGEQEWDYMWSRYLNETVPQEKIKLLFGMGKVQNVTLLERYLEWAMDESKIRSQDFFSVVAYIRDNPIGRPIVWDFIRENWLKIVQKFGIDHRYLGRMVPGVISVFNTEVQKLQVTTFFEKYPEAGAGKRGRIQALEKIDSNIAWMNTHETTIHTWLEANIP